jgi:hypothetical protein
MPSIRKIALFGLLAALATEARPVKDHGKRAECSRNAMNRHAAGGQVSSDTEQLQTPT